MVNEVSAPIWLLEGGEIKRRFETLDDAGLYIEWMNSSDPLAWPPGTWDDCLVLDRQGRRVYLKVEGGDVKNCNLISQEPDASDIERLIQSTERSVYE